MLVPNAWVRALKAMNERYTAHDRYPHVPAMDAGMIAGMRSPKALLIWLVIIAVGAAIAQIFPGPATPRPPNRRNRPAA